MLPEVFEAVPGQTDDEEAGWTGDGRGRDEDEDGRRRLPQGRVATGHEGASRLRLRPVRDPYSFGCSFPACLGRQPLGQR
jgi:hypothetical protein